MDLIALQHKRELDNKRKSRIVTIIVHAVILLLIFLPFLEYPVPAPGPEGVLEVLANPKPAVLPRNLPPLKQKKWQNRNLSLSRSLSRKKK